MAPAREKDIPTEAEQDRGYAYDASWNLHYRTNNGVLQTYTVDGENQSTGAPDGTQMYDANGNVVLAKTGQQTLTYDAENQLRSVINYSGTSPATKVEFTYDGLNRLRLKAQAQRA